MNTTKDKVELVLVPIETKGKKDLEIFQILDDKLTSAASEIYKSEYAPFFQQYFETGIRVAENHMSLSKIPERGSGDNSKSGADGVAEIQREHAMWHKKSVAYSNGLARLMKSPDNFGTYSKGFLPVSILKSNPTYVG